MHVRCRSRTIAGDQVELEALAPMLVRMVLPTGSHFPSLSGLELSHVPIVMYEKAKRVALHG